MFLHKFLQILNTNIEDLADLNLTCKAQAPRTQSSPTNTINRQIDITSVKIKSVKIKSVK